jgi:hypothetical protein
MAQGLGHLFVGLFELDGGTDELRQLLDRQRHFASGGERESCYQQEQATHTTILPQSVQVGRTRLSALR